MEVYCFKGRAKQIITQARLSMGPLYCPLESVQTPSHFLPSQLTTPHCVSSVSLSFTKNVTLKIPHKHFCALVSAATQRENNLWASTTSLHSFLSKFMCTLSQACLVYSVLIAVLLLIYINNFLPSVTKVSLDSLIL